MSLRLAPGCRSWLLLTLLFCGPSAPGWTDTVPVPKAMASTRGVARALSASQMVEAGFDPGQSAGLFIGVSKFTAPDGSISSEIAEIPFAVDDAVDLAHLFSLELGLVVPERVTLALSGEPASVKSRSRLQALLDAGARTTGARYADLFGLMGQVSAAAGSRGVLILSLASHGYLVAGDNRQRLFAQDSQMNALTYTGIPLEFLFEQAAASASPRRIVLVDACREVVTPGRAVSDPRSALSENFARAVAEAEGMVILQATGSGGYSFDDPARQNGVFTAAVVEGLMGSAAADTRGYITPATLAAYVDESVKTWVRKNRPQHAQKSLGMSYRTEPALAAHMPLAVYPVIVERNREERARRARMLGVLKDNLDFKAITGPLVQEVAEALERWDGARVESLLMELEVLERFGERYRAKFAAWWKMSSSGAVLLPARSPVDSVGVTPDLRAAGEARRLAFEPELAWIPGGEFPMGSAGGEPDETPVHRVEVDGFFMGKHEVTFDEYDAFCDESGREKPSDQGWGRGRRPVVDVSWHDAVAYCEWLESKTGKPYRLPTEAEWEYAARGSQGFEYATRTGELNPRLANYAGAEDGFRKTAPVGKFPANVCGLHDLSGNVWEWCSDWYGAAFYASSQGKNPQGPTTGSFRVVRGGCWGYGPAVLRAARRERADPAIRMYNYGFRCAVSGPAVGR